MDSITRLDTRSMPSGKPIVLFFMSPFCPYCRAQTEEIINDIEIFNNIQVCIFTDLPFHTIKQYADHYQLSKYKNIIVAQNYDSNFVDYFKVPGIPFMAIYDRNKVLKEVLIGKVNVKVIREIALE